MERSTTCKNASNHSNHWFTSTIFTTSNQYIINQYIIHYINHYINLVGGFNHLEKYESQCEGLSHILWKIKNDPNHQPNIYIDDKWIHGYMDIFLYFGYLDKWNMYIDYKWLWWCFEVLTEHVPILTISCFFPGSKWLSGILQLWSLMDVFNCFLGTNVLDVYGFRWC